MDLTWPLITTSLTILSIVVPIAYKPVICRCKRFKEFRKLKKDINECVKIILFLMNKEDKYLAQTKCRRLASIFKYFKKHHAYLLSSQEIEDVKRFIDHPFPNSPYNMDEYGMMEWLEWIRRMGWLKWNPSYLKGKWLLENK